MQQRKYVTAYFVAKIVEVLSWLILIGGVIAGIAIGSESRNSAIGIAIVIISIVFGLVLVFSSQLTLIFIDTENNTRNIVNEIAKTNAMLGETIGTIATNIEKVAKDIKR